MPEPTEPSRQTLDNIPGRVLTFVVAVARYPAIAALLGTRGYNQKVHDYAWDRLKQLGSLPATPALQGASDKAVRDAVIELDAWDEPNFEILRAVLGNSYPRFVDTLFDDLQASEGAEAVVGVSTLLDRLDGLETSTDPDAPAVLSLLAERSYTKAERVRLRGLVELTGTVAPSAPISSAERDKALRELYGWHKEWSTIAKKLISRRQHLIALGLATRRKAKAEPAGGGPEDPNKPA